jgi:5-methylcytosine-specific restriction endonuclease McrA
VERHKIADKELHRARRAANKEAFRQYDRTRYASNPTHKKELAKRSRLKHPLTGLAAGQRKRARKRNATIGIIDYGAIVQRCKGRCQICGKKVRRVDFSFDHIIPLSRGGPHSQENLQLAHNVCNSRRGTGRLPAQVRLPI